MGGKHSAGKVPLMEAIQRPLAASARLAGLSGLGLLAVALLLWRMLAITQSGASLYVDEAQYWVWAQDLAWGYFSKPPGIALLIRLSTALFGDGLFGVKVLAMACYPLAAWLTWLIARRLYDEAVAWWAALIVLTLPIYAWLGLFVTTDAPLTVLWLAGLWCYLRAIEAGRWRDWLALSVICGLGLLTKYTMAVFMTSAGLHLLVFHRNRLASLRPWGGLALALLLLAPNLAWNLHHDFPTLRHTADITLHRQAGGHWAALGEFVGAQILACGPLLGLALVWAAIGVARTAGDAGSLRRWRDAPGFLLLWFSVPLWCVVGVQAFSGGANANWAAPVFAPMIVVLIGWLLERGRQRMLATAVGLNLLLAALAYHAPGLLNAAEVSNPARYNPYVRAIGWRELAEELRPHILAHPDAVLLADNRTLLAHMRYELRDQQPTVVSWNPGGEASDHFRLTSDLNRHIGGDALLLAEHAPDAAILGRFADSQRLTTLRVSLDSTTFRQFEVYLLHGFQGY